MWRRIAIDEAGGWQHDTLTEDTDLSYRAQLKGWKFLYLQDVECPAELPVEMTAFKTQQARWAKGLIQVSKKILPKVFISDVPRSVKVEAWYHLTANLSYPLMIVLSVLLLPAMVIRFYQGWFQMLYIDLPLFMASTFSISSFYLVSQKELFPKTWLRTFLYLPFLMALGIVLTSTNTRAVLEALVGKQTAFARTPKYRVESKDRIAPPSTSAPGMGPMARTAGRTFRVTPSTTRSTMRTTSPSRSCCSSSSATGAPADVIAARPSPASQTVDAPVLPSRWACKRRACKISLDSPRHHF
jgi:hypothetical protein